MKPVLIIISDLCGIVAPNGIQFYLDRLGSKFDIRYYDARALASIGVATLSKQQLHNEFVEGGIDAAVANLLRLECTELSLLAFSIGGTIAWKAALKGLKAKNLYLISSTRLRYETQKPKCNIWLLYAENDKFRPKAHWFEKLDLESILVKNATHEIYKNNQIAEQISNRILKDCD